MAIKIYKPAGSAQIVVDHKADDPKIKEKTYATAAQVYMGFDTDSSGADVVVWVKDLADDTYILNTAIGNLLDEGGTPIASNAVEAYLLAIVGS